MSPTQPGWPNSARTVWYGARLDHPSRFASCVMSLGHARQSPGNAYAKHSGWKRLLEDAGIKLSAVASDILGVSGCAMLESLIVT
jgi:hypothetical protein